MVYIDPNLLPEYWIGEDLISQPQQFVRSPDGDEYLLIEEEQ